MESVIWKFELQPGVNEVALTIAAEILTVAIQGNAIMLWARVMPQNLAEIRTVLVVPTGHPFDAMDSKYIGTIFTHTGLVFHAFDFGAL